MKKVMDIEAAQRSLGLWLHQTSTGLDTAMRAGRAPLRASIEDSLLALRDDHTELPPAVRRLLGPLHPRTCDRAARLLLWARHAPAGPRCRTYRAALYLLQQLETQDVEETPVERVLA